MVSGVESFRKWFAEYTDQYTIIGGTACDLLMSEDGLDFRATRDIDMVLIVESLTPEFGRRLWEYVKAAGYEHRNKSTGEPQFYRFSKPSSREYPYMIELFSGRVDAIELPEDAVLTPLPLDDEISSLSAILMDADYYQFLREGKVVLNDIPVLDAARKSSSVSEEFPADSDFVYQMLSNQSFPSPLQKRTFPNRFGLQLTVSP